MLTIGGLGVPVWAEQGPGPILSSGDGSIVGTGAVVDVAVHPADPFILYAATAGGGVWRTRDAADNPTPAWEPLTDRFPFDGDERDRIRPGGSGTPDAVRGHRQLQQLRSYWTSRRRVSHSGRR